MPITRLASISRQRSGSRPPNQSSRSSSASTLNSESNLKKRPVIARDHTVDLADLQEWEPSSDEPILSLEEVQHSIQEWSEELISKGRELSGRTM
jgi:hypothetical protein